MNRLHVIFDLKLSRNGFFALQSLFNNEPDRFKRVVGYIVGSLLHMKENIINYGIDLVNTYTPKDTGTLRRNLIGWLSSSLGPPKYGDVILHDIVLKIFFDTNTPYGRMVNEFNTRKALIRNRHQIIKTKSTTYRRRTPRLRHNLSEKIKGASGEYLNDPKARKHFMQHISKLLIKDLKSMYRKMLIGINRSIPEATIPMLNSWFITNEKRWF